MRKVGILILGIVWFYSCQNKTPKEFVSLKGKFENNTDSLLMITGFSVKKQIEINNQGEFSDTLKVAKPDFYSFSTNTGKRGFIYLKNGYDLSLKGDSNNFFRTFVYEGSDEGADSNNLMIARYNLAYERGNMERLMLLEKQAMLDTIAILKRGMDSISSVYKNANTEMVKNSDDQNNAFLANVEKNYDRAHDILVKKYEALAKLEKGKPAPNFEDYEDYRGGKKSLKDLRGSYIYVDVWATWCTPCIAQFPFLKQLELEYKDKNIKFVSISTDNDRRSGGSWENAEKKWRAMVEKYELSGIQLWAGKKELKLSEDYVIERLPRFFIIDPEGKMVVSEAPRPFDPELKKIFSTLGI